MDAVITCIYDEGALEDTPLIGAKGFSVMVERDGRRVLFDTGLRDRYLKHNLENLEIGPESIDAVVVSQAHPDNCRALNGFLDLRETPVDVYAPAGLYQGKPGFLSTGVGVSDENRAKMNLREDEGWIEVFPGITVTPTYSFGAGSERYLIGGGGIRRGVLVQEHRHGKDQQLSGKGRHHRRQDEAGSARRGRVLRRDGLQGLTRTG